MSKIYKISNSVNSRIYVGSTTYCLKKRLCEHRSSAKVSPNRKIYAHLNKIGWHNVSISLIENVPVTQNIKFREDHHIRLLKPSLNSRNAIDICPHDSYNESSCRLCRGRGICEHGRQRYACKECFPNHICFECDSNFSTKSALSNHSKSKKHKKKLDTHRRMLFECLEEILIH